MKPLTDFLPRMLPYLPGCSEPLAVQTLLDSAIDFCEQSEVLREDLDPIITLVGVNNYELDAPSQQQVARVISVQLDGSWLQDFPVDYPDKPIDMAGRPTHFSTTRNGSTLELKLFPQPDAAYEIKVSVATRPLRTATQVEDDLFNLWVEPVVAGAISRVKAIPNQPFTDPQGALVMQMQAQAGVAKARREGSYGRIRGSLKVNFRPAA